MLSVTPARKITDQPFANPGTGDLRSPNYFMLWLLRQQPRPLALGVTAGIAWMVLQATIPLALGLGIQAAVEADASGVLTWAGAVLALGIGQSIAGVVRHRFAVTIWLSSASRCQQMVSRHIARLGADLPRQVATGEVVAVGANDVERIARVMDVLPRFMGAVVSFVVVGVVLLTISPFLGLVVLVGLPALLVLVTPLVKPLEKRENAQREQYGEASKLAADTVSGLRVLRGIGGERHFVTRFAQRSQQVRAAAVRSARIRALLDALQIALPGVFVVVVTFLGARLALAGTIDIGELVAFYGMTAFLVLPLTTVTELVDKYTRGRVSAARLITLLALTGRQTQATGTGDATGGLADARSGVSAPAGSLVAVVCARGDLSGELADRLGGMHPDGSEGVTLGGVSISTLDPAALRARVVVQDSDPMILSGTVHALLDVPASGRVSIVDAIRAASAADIIDGLECDPEGDPAEWLDELPERGRSLSGGQRQRLSLVRSLVADPDVLILDEPTSAVDSHTEARIADGLHGIRRGRTTVVFTTSPLMLETMDEVLFIAEETVTARGRHVDLMAGNPAYRATVVRDEEGS